MSILVLLRHGESVWNLENRFTGWTDVPLSPHGEQEAHAAGKKLHGHHFDIAYTSELVRAQKTLDIVLEEIGQPNIPVIQNVALNERHYGDLQGLNKAETAIKFGEEQVHLWRRSYAVAPPGGESLKDTADRTLPYFDSHIKKDLMDGKNVLVTAHGNSLRSIVMRLDNLSPEQVTELEIPTGVPIVYCFATDLHVLTKQSL